MLEEMKIILKFTKKVEKLKDQLLLASLATKILKLSLRELLVTTTTYAHKVNCWMTNLMCHIHQMINLGGMALISS